MDVCTLVNRTQETLSFTFDGVGYILEPLGEESMTVEAARFGYSKLIARWDAVTGMALYLTGIKDKKGVVIENCDPLEYKREPFEELIDRSNMEGNFKLIKIANPSEAKDRVILPQMSGPGLGVPKTSVPEEEE